jgi:hypothetical protein
MDTKRMLVGILIIAGVGCNSLEDDERPHGRGKLATPESIAANQSRNMEAARAGKFGPDGIEKVSRGFYCVEYSIPEPEVCVNWCPHPMSGWGDCYGDAAARPGELVMTYGNPKLNSCCQYTTADSSTHWAISGDWGSGLGGEFSGYIQNRQGFTRTAYQNNNYTGSSTAVETGGTTFIPQYGWLYYPEFPDLASSIH